MRRRLLFLLPLFFAIAACTTTSDYGRTQFVAPQSVGIAYSEVELQAQIILAPDATCKDTECQAVEAFRRDVRQVGQRLTYAARGMEAELAVTVPNFYVSVPDKAEQGTLSSASGSIVVFGGLHSVGFEDPALAFVVAREMGHVLTRHYEENSATNIVFSVIGSLLLPITNIVRGATASLPATSTLTATTTAASMAGSSIMKGVYRPDQLREADTVALKIMMRAGWTPSEVADALYAAAPRLSDEGWMRELLVSKQRLDQITMGPPWLPQTNLATAGITAPAAYEFQ